MTPPEMIELRAEDAQAFAAASAAVTDARLAAEEAAAQARLDVAKAQRAMRAVVTRLAQNYAFDPEAGYVLDHRAGVLRLVQPDGPRHE